MESRDVLRTPGCNKNAWRRLTNEIDNQPNPETRRMAATQNENARDVVMTSVEEPRRSAPAWSITAELRELMDGDTDMMMELFTLFLKDSAARLQTLSTACVCQDFKIVRAQAHSLKGSALQIGAGGLASLCAALESSDRPRPDECEPMMRGIADEFVIVRRAIKEYIVKAGASGMTAGLRAQDNAA
jgi:HPt (histidine-containing phosphotransfer) domain-containing protein